MKNSIIIFIRRNWLSLVLWFLNIISIVFILQIVFDIFPLFESNYPLIKAEKINSLAIDCSIGIITSTLFYILLVYIPERRKAKTARNAQKIHLQYLAEHMQFFILYLVKDYSLNVDNNDVIYSNIKIEEFSKVDISIFGEISKKYSLYLRKKDETLNYFIGYNEFGIHTLYKVVTKTIDKILSNPTIIFEDENLIELLNEIYNCKLFNLIRIYNSKESIAINCLKNVISTVELKSALIEYYKLYIRLLKYSSPNSFYINNDDIVSSK